MVSNVAPHGRRRTQPAGRRQSYETEQMTEIPSRSEDKAEKTAVATARITPACQGKADAPTFRAIGIPAVAAAVEQFRRGRQRKAERLPDYLRDGPFAS